jgi:hypothetical protein
MTAITYYAVLPFIRDEDGNLWPDEAVECPSAYAASTRAQGLVNSTKAGAVAFSRSGDPSTGEFDDAVVLARVGEVPADLSAMMDG